jgi:hypothetical protein
VKVDCNECGTPLTIAETTRFVTCNKCTQRLQVMRSETAIYTEVLSQLSELRRELGALDEKIEEVRSSASPVAPPGESLLRLGVGAVLIASDLYWWITDPTLQSLYVRILLLAAGAWLIVSGVWKTIESARLAVRHRVAARKSLELKRDELKRAIDNDANA